jgi:arsenite-transporting ATPase
MDYLLHFRERMDQARVRLTNPAETAFFFVTLPEALPIAVITRFINWFDDFGIPVGGVVVNMRIDRRSLGESPAAFVANRLRMQDDYMTTIWEKFDGNVRAIVPLFDDEVQGVAALRRLAGVLFRE